MSWLPKAPFVLGVWDNGSRSPNPLPPSPQSGKGEKKVEMMGDTPIPPALQAAGARMRWGFAWVPRS